MGETRFFTFNTNMIFSKRTTENTPTGVKCPVQFTKGFNISCFNLTLYDGFPGDPGTGWHTPTLSKINTQLHPDVLSAIRGFGVENLRVPCEPEWFWRNYPNEVGDLDSEMVDLLNHQADLLHAAGFKNLILGMFHLPNGNNGSYNWASEIINNSTFRGYYLDYVSKMVAATKNHYDSFYFMNEVGTQFGASSAQMALWQAWCTEAVDAVRSEAPDAWVVVPAPSYADPTELPKMTPIAREKIIYDIHFYEPFVFTHSNTGFLGAPFQDFVYLNDLKYPEDTSQCNTYYDDYSVYDINGSPPPWTTARLLGASVRDRILSYKNHNNVYHSTEEWIRAILLNAYNWGAIHKKPIMVGEWGTFATSISQKTDCRVATTANINSIYEAIVYDENTPWLNASLTGLVNGAIGAIDGISVVAGDRILVKNQTATEENGIYTVTSVGDVSNQFVLTRARDADSELRFGTYVKITSGTLNNGKYFQIKAPVSDVIDVGSEGITFSQFSPSITDNSPDDITSLRLWYRHVGRTLSEMGIGSFVWPTSREGYWNRGYGQFLNLLGTNEAVQKAINYIEDDTGFDYGTPEPLLPSVSGLGKISHLKRSYSSSSDAIQDMLNQASSNSVIDLGVKIVNTPLYLADKTNITLKGTLIGGVPTREWTPISSSDPLYSRFPAGTRDNIWTTTAPMTGPSPFGTVGAIQWGNAVVRNTAKFPTLIWDGEAMILARSPDYETGGVAGSTTTLIYQGTRPDAYASVAGLAVVGYFSYPWSPEMRSVSGINTGTKTLTCSASTYSAVLANTRFFYTNVPEELDSPGEYFIDRLNLGIYGRIYFIPPGLVDPNTKPSYITKTNSEPLLKINYCNELVSEVNLIGSTHGGLWVSNSNDILVRDCKISGMGSTAINLSGNNIAVDNVDVTSTQDISMYIASGNRKNFIPVSTTSITNCNFDNSSILGIHDTSALVLSGAGFDVNNCTFSESPGSSIRFLGNDMVVDSCTFTNVLKATRDNGVIYWGRNASYAGIEIRNCVLNYNNLLTPYDDNLTLEQNDTARSSAFAAGIYADDGSGSALIEDCTFNSDDRGIYMNGGRNVNVVNPIFNNCHQPWYYFGALTTPDVFGYSLGSLVGKSSTFKRVVCNAAITPTGTPQSMSVLPLDSNIDAGSPIFFGHSYTGLKASSSALAGATSVSVINYFSTGYAVLAGATVTCTSLFNSTSTPANMSVSALPSNIPAGQHIHFPGGKYVVMASSAIAGATTISVRSGPSHLPVNQSISASAVGTTVDIGTSGAETDVVCNGNFTSSSSTASMSVLALKRSLVAQTDIYFPSEDRFVVLQSDAAEGATSISVKAGVDGGGLINLNSVGKSGGYWQMTSMLHSSQIDEAIYLTKYPLLDVYFNGTTDAYRLPNDSSITNATYNSCKNPAVKLESFYGATFDEI